LVEEFARRLRNGGLIEDERERTVPEPSDDRMGAIIAALCCLGKDMDNRSVIPGIGVLEHLENSECFECPNKCGAEIIRVRVNGSMLTVGKACRS